MIQQDITKLIVRNSMKDRAAFDELYRHTSAKLFGVCLRVLKDRVETAEALQEVFIKVWSKADRFAVSELSPISLLVAITCNHAIDRLRARAKLPVDIADSPTFWRFSIPSLGQKRSYSPWENEDGSTVV